MACVHTYVKTVGVSYEVYTNQVIIIIHRYIGNMVGEVNNVLVHTEYPGKKDLLALGDRVRTRLAGALRA